MPGAAPVAGPPGLDAARRDVIEGLLPAAVRAVETTGDGEDDGLFLEERAMVADAVPRRQREFLAVRTCARRALAEFGVAPVAILPGERGAPGWPPGIVGSMTHCEGYRAAAVARAGDVQAIGIDAEPNEMLPDGVLGVVAVAADHGGMAAVRSACRGVAADRLLFSAKESVFKAWYPLTGRWLEFDEATVALDPDGTFSARFLVTAPVVGGRPLLGLAGRWRVSDGLILTAVVLPARVGAPRR